MTRGKDVSPLRATAKDVSWQQWVLITIACAAAVGTRYVLRAHATGDFTYYMEPWLKTLRAQGFAALGTDFANYNPPILYLLYAGTVLPLRYDLTIVKVVADSFDVLLAVASGLVVHCLRRSTLLAVLAGVGMLFVPEVLLNSGMWGQLDATYTSFLLLAAYFLLRRRDVPAWIMFALAFSFKLQALFFLPWIALAFIVQKHRWKAPALGLLTLVLTYVPSVLAGRSISSLAAIYFSQTTQQEELSANAANMYQWLPQKLYDTLAPAGKLYALGIVALLCAVYLQRGRLLSRPEVWLLQVGAAIGVVVPFVLPQMHDRYFYAAGVLTGLCAFVDRWYLPPAVLLQVTAFSAYARFLFNNPQPLSLPRAALVQLVAVVWIVSLSLVRMCEAPQPLSRHRKVDVGGVAQEAAPDGARAEVQRGTTGRDATSGPALRR